MKLGLIFLSFLLSTSAFAFDTLLCVKSEAEHGVRFQLKPEGKTVDEVEDSVGVKYHFYIYSRHYNSYYDDGGYADAEEEGGTVFVSRKDGNFILTVDPESSFQLFGSIDDGYADMWVHGSDGDHPVDGVDCGKKKWWNPLSWGKKL